MSHSAGPTAGNNPSESDLEELVQQLAELEGVVVWWWVIAPPADFADQLSQTAALELQETQLMFFYQASDGFRLPLIGLTSNTTRLYDSSLQAKLACVC